jgi:hypothetical protein
MWMFYRCGWFNVFEMLLIARLNGTRPITKPNFFDMSGREGNIGSANKGDQTH